METATHSFASRRPAAGGLPQFHLPAPNLDSQIPRVTGSDGLSPLASSINSSSSQSSHAAVTPYSSQGSWAVPGGSSYTYGSMSSAGPTGVMHHNYHRPLHSPTASAYTHRSNQAPAPTDNFTAPPNDNVSPPFPLPMSGGNYNHSHIMSQSPFSSGLQTPILGTQTSQPPTPSTSAPSDSYTRPPPTPSYYAPPSTTPQQPSYSSYASTQPSPTHPSPTTTGPLSRAIPSLSAQHSPMQAPPPYGSRSYSYPSIPHTGIGGPVLSNMGNPGGAIAIMGTINSMPHGYPPHLGHHGVFHHGQPTAQQERPFKCDVCTQSFNRNHDLKRHKRIHLAVKPFPCTDCEKAFSRKDALKRHRLVKGCGGGKRSPTSPDEGSPKEEAIKIESDGAARSGRGIKEELV
ncbi:hypothetical protein F5Y15DRAFT_85114 [Xylariaceae sp. FL0016]|nr:hypothetical protein F5Y15DRAFT_85114 [Xylariaceae sp. FL0016]